MKKYVVLITMFCLFCFSLTGCKTKNTQIVDEDIVLLEDNMVEDTISPQTSKYNKPKGDVTISAVDDFSIFEKGLYDENINTQTQEEVINEILEEQKNENTTLNMDQFSVSDIINSNIQSYNDTFN